MVEGLWNIGQVLHSIFLDLRTTSYIFLDKAVASSESFATAFNS
jgi:hypothetical protein